jgi:hypothetical protein
MSKSNGWTTNLTRRIVLKDRTALETLADVRAFILNEPVHIRARNSWQRAVELLMATAETGRGIEEATTKVEDALFLEARYVRTDWR